jgi:hypothetical protein
MASTPPTDTRRDPAPPTYAAPKRNGMGTAALVIGAISLVLAILIIFAILAFPLGLIAIILGAVGMARAKRGEADNRSHAVAGLVLGLLSIIVAFILGISFIGLLSEHQGEIREFGTCMRNADTDQERVPCIREFGNQLEDNG